MKNTIKVITLGAAWGVALYTWAKAFYKMGQRDAYRDCADHCKDALIEVLKKEMEVKKDADAD